jgi:transposase
MSVMSNTRARYAPELKAKALRMYQECRPDYPCDTAAMTRVAELLGLPRAETVRVWIRHSEVDAGDRPGTTSEESAEMRRLKRENLELKRANGILRAASAFFAAELDRPGALS